MTIVCGDSHTSTHGAFGALAFGIGTSEVEHVLATQTPEPAPPEDDADRLLAAAARRRQRQGHDSRDDRPPRHRRHGRPRRRVRRRDVRALSMEGRMTICNMTIEGGGKAGMIAPDDTTFAYLEGRPGAPEDCEPRSSAGASCPATRARPTTREVDDRRRLASPMVTWGTTPGMVAEVTAAVPDPAPDRRRPRRRRERRARPGLHGARAGHADDRDRARPRLYRLLHQLADRGPAPGRRDDRGPQGRLSRPRDRRARARSR